MVYQHEILYHKKYYFTCTALTSLFTNEADIHFPMNKFVLHVNDLFPLTCIIPLSKTKCYHKYLSCVDHLFPLMWFIPLSTAKTYERYTQHVPSALCGRKEWQAVCPRGSRRASSPTVQYGKEKQKEQLNNACNVHAILATSPSRINVKKRFVEFSYF